MFSNHAGIVPQAENFKSLTKKAEFLETRMGRAIVMMSLSLIKYDHSYNVFAVSFDWSAIINISFEVQLVRGAENQL